MPRLAFLADLHIANHRAHGGQSVAGLNFRGRLTVETLQRAFNRAESLGCSAVFILGDVFDTTKPEPQLVAAVQQVFSSTAMRVVVLEGNHDMVSLTEGDHSLGPLKPVAKVVTDVETWHEGNQPIVAIPFKPGPAKDWLPPLCVESFNALLLLHLGLVADDTPAFLRECHDAIQVSSLEKLCEQFGYRMVLSGNWHTHKIHKAKLPIIQVGTLCPTGWDNPGFTDVGTMTVWDSDKQTLVVERIAGPRFINETPEGLESYAKGFEPDLSVFVRVKTDKEQLEFCRSTLEHYKTQKWIAGYELHLVDVETKAAAKTAAVLAQSASTFEEALAGFISQMPLPENVERQDVLQKAQSFLSLA